MVASPVSAGDITLSYSASDVHIGVFYAFARSGGTLVNQLLGSHPDALVLSEVNPAASYKPVSEQAQHWLDLIQDSDMGGFMSQPYAAQVARLHELSRRRGKRLIVRDWVTVNYLPGTAGPLVRASGVLEQPLYLQREGLLTQGFVVCRRGVDVYESIKTNFEQFTQLELLEFAHAYLRFAQAIADLPRVHLEDLQANPSAVLPLINTMAGLSNEYCEVQLAKFSTFDRCTGDNTLSRHRTVGATPSLHIVPMSKQRLRVNTLGLAGDMLQQADGFLGYE
jgi:hypothetical protein